MKVVPVNGRLVVKPLKDDQMTKGGLVLPTPINSRLMVGDVINIGTDGNGFLGSRVVFPKANGIELAIDGETVLVVKITDIIAKFDSECSTTAPTAVPGCCGMGG